MVLFFNIWSTGIFVHVEIWSHSLEKFKPQQSYTSCKKTNDFRDESKIVFLVISNTKVVQFWTEFMYTCSLNIRWNKNYSFNVFSAVQLQVPCFESIMKYFLELNARRIFYWNVIEHKSKCYRKKICQKFTQHRLCSHRLQKQGKQLRNIRKV